MGLLLTRTKHISATLVANVCTICLPSMIVGNVCEAKHFIQICVEFVVMLVTITVVIVVCEIL